MNLGADGRSRAEEKARRMERLRKQAEGWLHRQGPAESAPGDLSTLLHEMQVHQVELEMQQEELLQSRAELEQSRDAYSLLYEAAPVAYFTLDAYGLVLRVNPRGGNLLGCTPAQLQGRAFRSTVSPTERGVFDHFIREVFRTGAKQTDECTLLRPAGLPLIARLEAQVVQPAGEPTRLLLAAIDVTDQKNTERRLRQREAELRAINEELEKRVADRTSHLAQALDTLQDQAAELTRTNRHLAHANADLDQFVYAASHDLKNPIANIEGLLHVLLRVLPPEVLASEDVQQITGHMQDSVNRFRNTIADLTEVARLQREDGEPVSPADLLEVFSEVHQDLTPLIEQTGARLRIDLEPGTPVRLSRKNLRCVVYNLLSNALKYHAPGRPPEVRLRTEMTPGFVDLHVEDNGLGMNEADLGKLFQLFKRLHTHVEGTGVGLYMVKKIVENGGGKIEVESRPGQGTAFTVHLPA